MAKIREQVGDESSERGPLGRARALFSEVALADEFAEFLTIPAYERMPD